MSRKLGFYLLGIATYQIALYMSVVLLGESAGWLFYFDPRIGLSFIQLFVGPESFPTGLSWISAAWLLGVAVALIHQRKWLPMWVEMWLPIYLILEAACAIPSLLMFVIAAAESLNPRYGFHIIWLWGPALVFLVSSVAPFTCAFLVARRLANEPLLTSGVRGPSR